MEENKKSKKGLIIACSCVILLVAAFVLIYALTLPKTDVGAKTITVQIVSQNKNSKEVEIKTDAEFLRQALEEKNLIEGTESTYGLMITTVDGVTADSAKQEWWCITKDGEQVITGADTTPVKDGDHFEITLTVGGY